MAPRANWKGFLRLSLVSCPIPLYPASSLSEKVSFIPLSATTGVQGNWAREQSFVRNSRGGEGKIDCPL
jgi:non-homologous end joining protein Ku